MLEQAELDLAVAEGARRRALSRADMDTEALSKLEAEKQVLRPA